MNILIACEESQAVCIAMRNRGHNAFSCDIQECSGGHPEWHILGDVERVLNGNCTFCTQDGEEHKIDARWDLIIGHPPCTFLSNAGSCRLFSKANGLNQERFEKGLKGKEFFMKILNADCDKICVENPIPCKIFELPEKSQVIQPYQFGHPYTKKTYLWLKGLEPLKPTDIVEPIGTYICGSASAWKKQKDELGYVIGKEKSAKHRSKTFQGVAQAMAEQWG